MDLLKKNLSVVIPVYNEEDNIVPLLEEIQTTFGNLFAYEIIVIDDGSNDRTPQLLQQAKLIYPQLRVLRHTKNAGQSASLLTGVRAAQYEWIATLDGDGQNNPADILKMMASVNDTIKVCVGYRVERQDNRLRKLSSLIANGIRNALLQDDCPDTGCGIKLFPRTDFLNLPHFRNYHRFLPALFKRAHIRIQNVPVSHRPRRFGTSKYGVLNRLGVGIVDLFGVAWLMRRPLETTFDDDTQTR